MIYLTVILILGVIIMTIHIGSSKIGRIFVGNQEIAKVYHGSTLVFENVKKIPVYGYQDRYLLGSNSTSGLIVGTALSTLATVGGTLGASGSTITVTGDNTGVPDGSTYTYSDTITFNGVKIYAYERKNTEIGVWWRQYVIEDAKIGSKCMQYTGFIRHGYTATSVSATSMTYGQNTFARVAANDTNFTRNGFKQ